MQIKIPDIEKPIIETRALKEVGEKIKRTINKNEWLVIAGKSGTGKNTAVSHHLDNYRDERHYIIVESSGILFCYKDLTNSIMSQCVRSLLPSEKAARDVFARYTQFQRALIEAESANKKLILLVNEAQRLNQDTIYGIKMLHEAGQKYHKEHLFAIIFVGQLSVRRKLVSHELNFRIRRYEMKTLQENEVEAILNLYGYTCNKSILGTFASNSHHTPNGVHFYIDLLRENNIPEGELTIEHLYNLPGFAFRERMKARGWSNQYVANLAKENIGLDLTASSVSKIVNGKMPGPTADELTMRWHELEAIADEKEKNRLPIENINMA